MFSEKNFLSRQQPGEYLKYLEYTPENMDTAKPLIIYIHGAGSRGDDLSMLLNAGLLKHIKNGRKLNAVVIAPQCRFETWFDIFPVLAEFIDDYRNRSAVDPNRVYITGASMGGYTTWQMCISHPEWFAAAVPVCGGGMYWNAKRLKDLPVWAFHGAMDRTVLPEESLKMVAAINRCGGNAKLTVFPQDEHNSWDNTYSLDEMWEWLFAQQRENIRKL